MVKFKCVPGATVYNGLFKHYVAPDGEQCYLYHHSKIVCEALDPGPYPKPKEPLYLEQILRTEIPAPPPPDMPERGDEHPPIYFPEFPLPPSIVKHAVPSCMLTGIFGGVSSEATPLFVREQSEEVQNATKEEKAVKKVWLLPESPIFGPRTKESDSKDFFDTDQVKRRSLVVDWKRLLQEDRFQRFVFRNDEEVKYKEQAIEEEVAEIRQVFGKCYGKMLRLYDFYCAVSTATGRSAHAIQQNSFLMMLKDCDICNEECTVEDCTKIFVIVNFEEDKTSFQSEVNEDKALMRHELVEALVRMAVQKHGRACKDVSDCVEMLMDHIMEKCPVEATIDPDEFRRERFYTEKVEGVCKRHWKELRLVYEKYSMLNPQGGKARFGLDECLTLFQDAKMLGIYISSREIRLIFFQVRMLVIDEVKSRYKFTTLSWVEFVELVARAADCVSIPSNEDLSAVGASNVMDFELKLTQHPDPDLVARLRTRRPSSGLAVKTLRPLSDRLDRFIHMLMGRLAIVYRGMLSLGQKSMKFVPKYISKQQLEKLEI